MRIVVVLFVVAAGALGILWHLAEDDAPRDRRSGVAGRRAVAPEPVPERHGFLSCEFRIETAAGSPADGAEISYEGPARGTARAGDDGEVRLDGLARGFYTLQARRGAEMAGLRFELRQTEHLGTLRLAGAAAIRGRVLDAYGRALSGAVVEAVMAGEPAARDLTQAARALAEPDGVAARASAGLDGSYSLEVAAGRRYGLRAQCADFAVGRRAPFRVAADTTVDFRLSAGLAVAGRVVDERGFGVGGARVLVSDPTTIAVGGAKAETLTGGDGSFRLVVEPVPGASLVVRADGFAPYMHRPLSLPADGLRVELERGFTARLRVVAEEDPARGLPGISVAVDLQGGFALGVTDANGELTLSNLPARRRVTGGEDLVLLWGGGRAFRMHPVTEVPRAGELALGDLPLGLGGTVTGRVVRDGDESPIPGATVHVFGGVPPGLAGLALPTAQSGRDGRFELRGAPLGATHVFALHPEYEPPAELARVLAGQAAAGGGPLFLDGEDVARREIVLRPAGSVAGLVTGEDGKPAAGARIEVLGAVGRVPFAAGAPPAATTAGADGRFTLRVAGRVTLVAHRDSLRSVPVETAVGDEVTLALEALATLRGSCVDEARQPVAGVRVSLATVGPGDSAPPVAVTDAAGRFALPGLAAGAGSLRLDHPGHLAVETEFCLPSGEEEHTLAPVVLERGPTIRGRVVDEADRPVADVEIAASMEQGAAHGGRFWGDGRTDAEGRFAIHGLANGRYRLQCRKPGFVAHAPTAPTDGEPVRVVLRAAASLRGRVVADGRPVAGAVVDAQAGDATGFARTRADGRFVLDALPPEAKVDLVVRHDAYREAAVRGADPQKEQTVELESGVRIGGTVVLPDGTPVPGAYVEVLAGAGAARTVVCDARGTFRAGGLPEGELKVRVLESGQGLLRTQAAPATAGDERMRLVVERGESITGRVLLADGRPAAEVRIVARRRDGSVAASAWIDRAGQGFALRGLATGAYDLRADRDPRPNRPAAHATLPNVPAGTAGVELRLEAKR
ncbi:MAG: carboxypeptidase regulatory-like domain-containing protein [Planctomycetota bacterium]|jgi:protocatechuate 3,4-dioxygenase beta subunit